jgi:hypothetical protein
MTMDENVAKAVERADLAVSVGMTASLKDWQTIRARLVELEAENERLLAGLAKHVDRLCEQRDRAEKAEALLRECVENREGLAYETDLLTRITAHLSENGHG